jgi:hypothetical protein
MTELKQKLHENEDIADVAVESDSAEDSITDKIGEIEEMCNEMIAASADSDEFFTAEEKSTIENLHEAIQAVYDSVMDRADVEGEAIPSEEKPVNEAIKISSSRNEVRANVQTVADMIKVLSKLKPDLRLEGSLSKTAMPVEIVVLKDRGQGDIRVDIAVSAAISQ